MTRLVSLSTIIECELPAEVTRLELVSPFLFSEIQVENEENRISFEVMALEWLSELSRFLTLDIYPPSEYRTNLTPGGDEFYGRLIAQDRILLSVYDKLSNSRREVVFSAAELLTLVGAVYDQIIQEFTTRSSSPDLIETHRATTLSAISRWQARLARSDVSEGGSHT